LTQEEILKQHVIEEHARQQKEAAALAQSHSQDTYQIVQELEECRHLLIKDTEVEREKDMATLVMLGELEREQLLDHCYQQYQVCKEMENLKDQQEVRARRMAKLIKEKKRREELERKQLSKVCDLLF
jgi:hypothetical protein